MAEMWKYPGRVRILELPTKGGSGEAFRVAAETTARPRPKRIDLSDEQQTKIRTSIEFFAGEPVGADA